MMTRLVCVLGLTFLGVFALACTATSEELYDNAHVADSSHAYQWAELSDEQVSPFPSFLEASSILGSSAAPVDELEAETEEGEDFALELMELRAAINIDSIIQGRQNDDAEYEAALLEMEISSALSAEASPADFFRFARTHSRLYATEKAAAAAFAAFKQNKKASAELNAKFGITSESNAVFSATGPLGSMTPAAFKKKLLTAKNPRGKSRGRKSRIGKVKRVAKSRSADTRSAKPQSSVKPKPQTTKPKPQTAKPKPQAAKPKPVSNANTNNKPRSAKPNNRNSLQPQSQRTGGGRTAGQAGSAAGDSGGTGGKSGRTGGDSGRSAGEAGSVAQKSGKTGGGGVVYTGLNSGTIALPNKDANRPNGNSALGYTDPKVAEKMGITPAKLKEYTIQLGGIGEQSYTQTVNQMKQSKLVGRPAAYNPKGEYRRVMPIQDNDCGSCWAIAVQQSLQRYWTRANFKGTLSIQQLLDCIRTVDSKGCAGGTPMQAFEFWATNLAASEDDYPTVMKDQQCKKPPYPKTFVGYPSGGWEMLVPECADDDRECIGQVVYEMLVFAFTRKAGFMPPIAYVDASQWQNYKGGIFPPSMCKSTMEAGNHVVQIVGSGVDNLGIPYWILDNFWGESWGESGRIRVPWGINACGLFNFAIYATPPPFEQGKPANYVPAFNDNPVPYVPRPITLGKIDPKASSAVLKASSAVIAKFPETNVPNLATYPQVISTKVDRKAVILPTAAPVYNPLTGKIK